MYNINERGSLLGVHNRVEIIVRHRRRLPIKKMDGSHEWVTVVECTCAGSFMLPPLVIYKGEGLYRVTPLIDGYHRGGGQGYS